MKKGYFTIATGAFITFVFWLLSKPSLTYISDFPLLSISQIFALLGIYLMSVSILMSTRMLPAEELFGGLDKTYKAHHVIGSTSFVLILSHPLLMAFNLFPNFAAAKLYLFLGRDPTYNFGIFALYALLLAFIFIVFIKLPYHIWRYTHKLMAVAFLFASLHALNIGSDIDSSYLLKTWVILITFAGGTGAVYTLFLYSKFGPKYKYKINKVEALGNILNIYLSPLGKRISFLPGQFGYFKFENKKIGREVHPFSFSSDPNSELIRISVKQTGDFTRELDKLKSGDLTHIYGPYGRFYKPFLNSNYKNLICVAGGIGITPFLAMLKDTKHARQDAQINLFYSYKTPGEDVFRAELEKLTQNRNAILTFWCSGEMGKLTAEQILKNNNLPLEGTAILLCGPLAMMENLKTQFIKLGASPKDIFYEDFDMI